MGNERTNYKDIPILDIASRCGLTINSKTLGRIEIEAVCPFCGDRPGRYHFSMNTVKNQYYCQLCGAGGNSVSLYAKLSPVLMTYVEAVRELTGEDKTQSMPRKQLHKPSMEQQPKPLYVRHDVYYEMLSHLTLSDRHMNDLRKRGLSDERIAGNMYKTLPESGTARMFIAQMLADFYDLKGVPGFYTDRNGRWTINGNSGLLIPYCTKDGYIQGMQIRLDEENRGESGRGYRWLSSGYRENGTKSKSYIHVTGDITSNTAYLTEGGLKGDVASFFDDDALFVCIAGANSLSGLAGVISSLGVTEIIIAADMDKVTNPNVREAFEKAEKIISEISGVKVQPSNWNVGVKGIDDYRLMKEKVNKRGQDMNVKENHITDYVRDLWKKEYPKQDSGWIGSCEWVETVIPLKELKFHEPKDLKKAKLYKEKVDAGVVFPPVICINGIVIDGLHRCWAYSQAGKEYVHVYQNKPIVLETAA